MTPGETYATEVKVVRVKKGRATVIIVDGQRYILDMSNMGVEKK